MSAHIFSDITRYTSNRKIHLNLFVVTVELNAIFANNMKFQQITILLGPLDAQ